MRGGITGPLTAALQQGVVSNITTTCTPYSSPNVGGSETEKICLIAAGVVIMFLCAVSFLLR